ncbi:YoaK family protein [Levilactobacillus zymae]|uniref:YoaK family protein n=1 Tax=Levilactobacillus zymae TaxID=267363 RepID=UPI0028BC2B3C|nr:YoaK family protein [Levilactobacillus zymae]MDT6979436.1 YoaK family protein [Levilactobacillus zymae]
MGRYQTTQIFQLREIGLGLTFIGGFIDAYTFVQRGGALAAGQTGNLIFLSVDVAQRDLPGALTKLATVLAFMLGVMAVRVWEYRLRPRSHYWRLLSLVAELVVCGVVGALPANVPNYLITPPLALVMAMQTTAFGTIAGHGYNNVFSTGNLKKATSALAAYGMSSDPDQLMISRVYFELVGAFAGGAMVSALLQTLWGTRTIWVAMGVIGLVGGYYIWLLFRRSRATRSS